MAFSFHGRIVELNIPGGTHKPYTGNPRLLSSDLPIFDKPAKRNYIIAAMRMGEKSRSKPNIYRSHLSDYPGFISIHPKTIASHSLQITSAKPSKFRVAPSRTQSKSLALFFIPSHPFRD
jgi:hypothetical protein